MLVVSLRYSNDSELLTSTGTVYLILAANVLLPLGVVCWYARELLRPGHEAGPSAIKQMDDTFAMLDVDGSGHLTPDEIQHFVVALAMVNGEVTGPYFH